MGNVFLYGQNSIVGNNEDKEITQINLNAIWSNYVSKGTKLIGTISSQFPISTICFQIQEQNSSTRSEWAYYFFDYNLYLEEVYNNPSIDDIYPLQPITNKTFLTLPSFTTNIDFNASISSDRKTITIYQTNNEGISGYYNTLKVVYGYGYR